MQKKKPHRLLKSAGIFFIYNSTIEDYNKTWDYRSINHSSPSLLVVYWSVCSNNYLILVPIFRILSQFLLALCILVISLTGIWVLCKYPLDHGILARPFLVLSILARQHPFVPITSVSGLTLPWDFPCRN